MAANYGLLGEHLSHSYSKQIHEALADYTYNLIELSKEELKEFMTAKDFAAVNVTIPYKRDVFLSWTKWMTVQKASAQSTPW